MKNMNITNEEERLMIHSNEVTLDKPRSIQWQIFQGSLYLIGSICFTIGSCLYFTKIFHQYPSALTFGGWLFTSGSFIFLFADLQDWWDYRTGYCFNKKYQQISDTPHHSHIELNVYGSLCGIALYLAGSILFIPTFANYLTIGEWFFILGSTFCSISLLWKIYRLGTNNINQKFHCRTLFNEFATLLMDSFSMIGNICFFIGTICFLPYINKDDFAENRAAFFFVFGSGCFLLSSIILQYTICCSHKR